MPKYYIDVDDGARQYLDAIGCDRPDAQAARVDAISILPDMARSVQVDDTRRAFVSKVRDGEGKTIFMATLSLTTEWL